MENLKERDHLEEDLGVDRMIKLNLILKDRL
jgi:hypothetical protein